MLRDRLQRMKGSSEHTRINIRGRYKVTSLANTIEIQDRSNLAVYWSRGSLLVGDLGSPSAPRRPLTIGEISDSFSDSGAATVAAATSAGATTITLASGTVSAGQWYYLRDINKTEQNTGSPTAIKIGGELVKVKTVSGSTVTLYHPITQSYASAAQGGDVRFALLPAALSAGATATGAAYMLQTVR